MITLLFNAKALNLPEFLESGNKVIIMRLSRAWFTKVTDKKVCVG